MRICISGAGIVSPIGIGREAFWDGLATGRNGIGPVDLFDCAPVRSRAGAQVKEFDAARLIGPKGLRYVDRPSQFALAAAQLAMADARLDRERTPPERLGVVLGTAFGGQSSLEDCNRERVAEGPQYLSPAKFPNTPINAMSYQIPIRHKMRLVNTTVSSGMNSGLDALFYAASILRRSPDGALIAGGVEELSRNAYFSCYFRGELAGMSGAELSCPFDRRRNGYVLGEGASLFVLEDLDAVRRSGRQPLAELRAFGSAAAGPDAAFERHVEAATMAIRSALAAAQVDPGSIDYVVTGANSGLDADLAEAQALARVFGERLSCLPVAAVKSMTGEAYGASGGYQVAAAVLALERGILSPTINLESPDPECRVRAMSRPDTRADVRTALVTSFDRFGRAACAVVARAAA